MKFSTAHIPLEPSTSPSVRHIHRPDHHLHHTHLPLLPHLPRHHHHHHHHHQQELPPPIYHLCTRQHLSADLDTFSKLPIHGDAGYYCIGEEENCGKDSQKEASWPPHRLSEVSFNPSSNSFDHRHEREDTAHPMGYPLDLMNQKDHTTVKGKQHGDLSKVSTLDYHSDSDLSSTRINSIGGVVLDSARVKASTNDRIKLLCSFGGKIMPRPMDGKLRYVGGDTHILNVARNASFRDVMSKLIGYFSKGSNLTGPFRLKYQLPNEDLDALISVTSDDDMQNMIEECEKVGDSSRLRLFFFASSGDIDVVVSEPKPERREGEYGDSSTQEQLYVNAINGNLCLDTSEDLGVVSRGFHQQQQQEAYLRKAYIKDVDMPNVMTHSKVPSTPPISAPCSPSLALRYKSGLSGSDSCLQSLREQLSKVAIKSQQFDNQFDLLASSSNSSHHDPQFYMAAESPKVAHHNLTLPQCRLANCQCKHDMEHIRPTDRHHEQQFIRFASDSPRMVHHDLSINPKDEAWPFIDPNPSHVDCSIVSGNAMEHCLDISHQRLAQPIKHSIPQQLNRQFDLQRSWYQQSDLDSGTTEHNHSDFQYKQRQNFHRFYHQPSQDFPNPNFPERDVSYGNAEEHGMQPFVQGSPRKHTEVMYPWNAEEHGKSTFGQASPRKLAQTMHGSSRSFASHMGSSPPSPRLSGAPDSSLKCSCGLQNTQVHRGVTASIGDQSCNRWPRHAASGDVQSMKKNGCRPFSRFCDNVNHCIDSQFSHQSAIRTAEIDCRDHQIGNPWCRVHGRASRDCQVSGYQPIDCVLHYTDLSSEYAKFAPPSHECYDTRRKCFCRICFDRYQLVMGDTDSSFTNRKNQVPESGKQRKGFELNGEILSKLVISKEETFGDFVGKRRVENEYGVAYSCNVLGGLDARRSIEARNEGVTCERRPVILQSGLIQPPKEHARDGQLENFPTMPSPVHAWVENAMLSYAPGGTHLLCPDIIPLGSIAITEESSYIAHTADYVPISTVTVDDCCLNAPVSPVYDKTPLNCTNTTSFSFTPSNEDSPRAELTDEINEDLFGSPPSVTKLLADGMISSILDSSSNEGIYLEDDKEIKDSFSNRGILLEEEKELEDSSSNEGIFLEEEKELEDSTSNEGIFLAEEKEVGESSSNEDIFPEEEDKDKDPVVVYIEANQSLIDMGNEIEMPGDSNLEDSPLNPIAMQTKDSLVIVSARTANGWMKVETEVNLETILTLQNSAEKVSVKEIIGTERSEEDEEVAESKGSLVEEEAVDHGLQIIRNADLEDLKELGSGTFGTVFHGKWRGSDVAIKRIRASCFTDDLSQRERLINDFWKEARTLGQLHHPNVVAFYGVVPDGPGGTLATVTEYMVNGSLKQVLHKKDRTIDRRKRLFIAMDAAFGMEYLHSKNIVHFDLKCENLLVNMRDAHRPICKVGDFGLSKVKHQTLVSGGVRGTLPWMAPELLSGNGNMVTEKVDVFSFGVVMWELLTGEEPYASMHCGAIIAGIVNNTLRPSIPNWCDPGWRSLMEQCWSGDPSKRPTFSDVARELRAIAASMNMK